MIGCHDEQQIPPAGGRWPIVGADSGRAIVPGSFPVVDFEIDKDGGVLPGSLPLVDFGPARDVGSLVRELPTSDAFREARRFFQRYPPRSLLSATSRSLLYFLTRQLSPRVVLEIGTYYAGTAEVFARALRANGRGQLLTVDPYGAERVPPVIAAWPEDLREKVVFLASNSMQCFMEADHRNILFDLAFIDGDHSYEFALFDLSMVARQANPGAVVVMDNCEQPGVFWAVKTFLRDNEGWTEIGNALAAQSDADPFGGMRPSFPGSSFLILQAPTAICLGSSPRSFVTGQFAQKGLRGFEFEADPDHPEGMLHAMTFFRSFYHDLSMGEPEQKMAVQQVHMPAGQSQGRVVFGEPFFTEQDPVQSYRRAEFILVWQPRSPNAPLRLTKQPTAVVAD